MDVDYDLVLCDLLKLKNFSLDDVIGISLTLKTNENVKEMCDWLKINAQATRDEIYDKFDEIMGIEPLTDEDFENLSEDDYILGDETED